MRREAGGVSPSEASARQRWAQSVRRMKPRQMGLFTTLTSIHLSRVRMDVRFILNSKKDQNVGALLWFCSAGEPLLLKPPWACVYCGVMRPRPQAPGWAFCICHSSAFSWVIAVFSCMFDFLKGWLWERFRVVFVFFLIFSESYVDWWTGTPQLVASRLNKNSISSKFGLAF